MSKNRENVTWQNAQGSWSIGFYDFTTPAKPDEDFDEEWDVEYLGHLGWVSTGHPTPDGAYDAYIEGSCNPGHTVIVRWCGENEADIATYEQLAADFAAKAHEINGYW